MKKRKPGPRKQYSGATAQTLAHKIRSEGGSIVVSGEGSLRWEPPEGIDAQTSYLWAGRLLHHGHIKQAEYEACEAMFFGYRGFGPVDGTTRDYTRYMAAEPGIMDERKDKKILPWVIKVRKEFRGRVPSRIYTAVDNLAVQNVRPNWFQSKTLSPGHVRRRTDLGAGLGILAELMHISESRAA